MASEALRDRLIEAFAAILPDLPRDEIPLASPNSVGEWDSLATVNLIAVLAEEFGVAISPDEYDNLGSFDLVLELLERKLHAS
jgi:acyl carrier protein